MTRLPLLCALAACVAVLVLPAGASAADTLYGVTGDNEIITLNSSAPGNVERSVAISGLAPSESIVAIDVRPATDALFALGSTSRIYQLNPVTGVLRAISANDPFAPGLSGTSFGLDFNPTVDRIRLVSDAEQNQRVNPDTGATGAADAPLAYAAGDPGAGADPAVGSSAYTNSVAGATSTVLYAIDSARDALVTQDPPNAGVLNTVGPLGVDAAEPVAFDITAGGTAYAAFKRAGQSATELFAIDLSNGRAAGAARRPIIATKEIRALAVAGPVAADGTSPALSVAFSSTQLEENLLRRGLVISASCDEDCTIAGLLTIAGRAAGSVSGERIAGEAGRRTIRFALNAGARRQIRRSGNVVLRLVIAADDSAGNRRGQTRISRTQTLAQRRSG